MAATMPIAVWVEGLSPADGASVRIGDAYRLSYRLTGPVGTAFASQVFVGDETTPGAFTTMAFGGCGSSTSPSPMPPGKAPAAAHRLG